MASFTIDSENKNFINAIKKGLSSNLLNWYFDEITNLKNKSDKREVQKKNKELIDKMKIELSQEVKKITITIE